MHMYVPVCVCVCVRVCDIYDELSGDSVCVMTCMAVYCDMCRWTLSVAG